MKKGWQQGPGLAVLGVAMALFIAGVMVLEITGVERWHATALTAVMLVAGLAHAILGGGTTRPRKFFHADKAAGRQLAAMSLAATAVAPPLLLSSGALSFDDMGQLVAIMAAALAGLALSSILIGRQMGMSGHASTAEMIAQRYRSALPSRLHAITGLVAWGMLAAGGIASGGLASAWFFGLSQGMATLSFALIALACVVIGGTLSQMRVTGFAGLLFLAGLNLPLLHLAITHHGFPVGQLVFGVAALEPVLELESQLRSAGLDALSTSQLPAFAMPQYGQGLFLAFCFLMAGGVAMLSGSNPANLATEDSAETHRTGMHAIGYLAFLSCSLMALMAFVKLGFYEAILGVPANEARFSAPFLYDWSGNTPPLLKLCNMLATSRDMVTSVCGGADHVITAGDITLDGTLLLGAAPDLADLPFAFTALLSAGLLSVLLAFTALSILTPATMVAGAFYGIRPGHVPGFHLFLARLATLAIATAAALAAQHLDLNWTRLAMLALGLAAAAMLPAQLDATFNDRATATGATMSIAAGLAVTLVLAFLAEYGIDLTPRSGDEWSLVLPGMADALPAEFSGLAGLPVSLLALVAGNWLFRSEASVEGAAFARGLSGAGGEDSAAAGADAYTPGHEDGGDV